jgi:hypothetical protein
MSGNEENKKVDEGQKTKKAGPSQNTEDHR